MSKSSIAGTAGRWDLVRIMAEHPELWTDTTPEQRYLFDRPPSFGLARDAERMRGGITPVIPRTRVGKVRRVRGPFVTYLRLPWAYGDRSGGAHQLATEGLELVSLFTADSLGGGPGERDR